MEEQTVRAAIDRHWAASAAGDQVAEHEIYHDDAACIYPQSGEVIHGRQNLQALRSHHPGKPSGFVVRRIVGEGNLWVTEYAIDYEGKSAFTVSIMEFRDGKVARETQYFAVPFEAPAWRQQWVEGLA
ncbi:nuclear transport factor 2 family protein [Variovorax sp. efr-133-TYG-130]|uniref:nuclear transport factor 2 family protein n=1 Tax=Variovorax sp. efr-133-TYG-130 TaxID=3040327 RepID=UPI0025552D65|nr:nuclear transport factor 2 family protein [Variovorax sp. efr-133-TYG-130]